MNKKFVLYDGWVKVNHRVYWYVFEDDYIVIDGIRVGLYDKIQMDNNIIKYRKTKGGPSTHLLKLCWQQQ